MWSRRGGGLRGTRVSKFFFTNLLFFFFLGGGGRGWIE